MVDSSLLFSEIIGSGADGVLSCSLWPTSLLDLLFLSGLLVCLACLGVRV